MIKNQRQYALTQGEIKNFKRAIAEWNESQCPEGVAPAIYKLQLEGMKSQLDTLSREVAEYDSLLAGDISSISLNSLEELPHGLIKARIARGMTQRNLADAMGLKQQQIQRWEFEDYENVSFSNILGVANALDLNISECIRFPRASRPAFSALNQMGIPKNFIRARLVPSCAKNYFGKLGDIGDKELLVACKERLENIFGYVVNEEGALSANDDKFLFAAANGRFKLPTNADPLKVRAYATYAAHLGSLVQRASEGLPKHKIPMDWQALRQALSVDAAPTFEQLVRGAWGLGIPILPLVDPIRFHGFCYRVDSRNIVILKQSRREQARWAFDLLHEIYHAAEAPDKSAFQPNEMDATEAERRESEDENRANELSGNILLGGRANELFQRAYELSMETGGLQNLKKIAKDIADSESINIGYLANYFAYRLRNDFFVDWWGVAANLQPEDADPVKIAKDILLEQVDLSRLSADERDLLLQAIEPATI